MCIRDSKGTLYCRHIEARGGGHVKNTGKFAVTGGLAGLCNGLFGAGGGLFLVPLLTQWAGLEQRKAFATSVAVILPLSLVSAAVYWLKGGVDQMCIRDSSRPMPVSMFFCTRSV